MNQKYFQLLGALAMLCLTRPTFAFYGSVYGQFGFGGPRPVYLGNQVVMQPGIQWRPFVRCVPVLDYAPVPTQMPVLMPIYGQAFPGYQGMYNPQFPFMQRSPFGNPFSRPRFSRGGGGGYHTPRDRDFYPRIPLGPLPGPSEAPPGPNGAPPSGDDRPRPESPSGRPITDAPFPEGDPTLPPPESTAPPRPGVTPPRDCGPKHECPEPPSSRPTVSDPIPDGKKDEVEAHPGPCVDPKNCPYTPRTQTPEPPDTFDAVCDVLEVAYQHCDACSINPDPDKPMQGIYFHYDNDKKKWIDTDPKNIDVSLVRSTHPYLKNSKPNCPAGIDLMSKPFVFHIYDRKQLGAKPGDGNPKFDENKKSIDLFPRPLGEKQDHYGLDCTGFLAAVFARAGWRVFPDSSKHDFTTTKMVDSFFPAGKVSAKPDGVCFEISSFEKDKPPLQAGDVFIRGVRGGPGHSLIVRKVGEDPFGMKALGISSASDCTHEKFASRDNLDKVYGQIYVAQSNVTFGGIGPMTAPLSTILRGKILNGSEDLSAYYTNTFANMALRYCKSQFDVGSAEDRLMLAGADTVSSSPTNPGFFMRHKSTDNCKTTPYNMDRAECVSECVKNQARPASSGRPSTAAPITPTETSAPPARPTVTQPEDLPPPVSSPSSPASGPPRSIVPTRPIDTTPENF